MARSSSRFLFLATALAWLALTFGAVMAQANLCGIEREVKPKPLDEHTWQRLNRIYETVGEEDYKGAYDELLDLEHQLTGFERRVSDNRRDRYDRLDALSAELVRRYREGEASVDGLLSDG